MPIYLIMIVFTLFNFLLLGITVQIIIDFRKSQIDFINQQNRNTAAIFDIKNELNMFERK